MHYFMHYLFLITLVLQVKIEMHLGKIVVKKVIKYIFILFQLTFIFILSNIFIKVLDLVNYTIPCQITSLNVIFGE